MNPFSGFLQPAPQRPIDMSGVGDVVRTLQQQKEFKQHQLENTQRYELEQRGATRADSELALQQGEQSHRFGLQDQKQVEDALAEYHDAVDTGDPVRIGRATDMLKRFGMNVGGQGARPDLKVFTGQSLLPNVQQKPSPEDLQALTGQPQNPIDQAIKTELASRDALRARDAESDQEKPVEDLEEPDIAGHLKSVANLKALPTNTPEQQEAEFAQAAQQRKASEVVDLDEDDPTPLQIGKPVDLGDVDSPQFQAAAQRETASQAPQTAAAMPPRLPGQLLPTIISKNGKVLEESQGQAGRYSPMVAATFEPFANHENPSIAAAGRRAQGLASRLVNVDGISPKQAIEFAGKQLENEMLQINNLERTKIGSKAHVMGGPGGGGLMGKTQDIAQPLDTYTQHAAQMTQKLQDEDSKYASIEAKVGSNDPGVQKDGINELLQVRSGTAVTASEDKRVMQLNGMIDQLANAVNHLSGAPMTPRMVATLRNIVALKRKISADKIQRIYDYQAESYAAQNEGKVKDPSTFQRRVDVIKKGGSLGGAGSPDPNADLDR